VHCVVPGGGISPDGSRWIGCRPGFFLPVRVLSRLFRRLFLEALQKSFEAGALQFFSNLEALRDKAAFAAYLAAAANTEWVVYAKAPFGGPARSCAIWAATPTAWRSPTTACSAWNRDGDQILAPLDQEMARIVEGYVEQHGIRLALNDGVAGFEKGANDTLTVLTKSGKSYPADVVILALGVRPDTTLAKAAGLEVGQRGGIRVDEHMRTTNPDIFAVGDAVEVKDFVTGEWSLVALAGPANRQGRIAADVIAGRESRFRGTRAPLSSASLARRPPG